MDKLNKENKNLFRTSKEKDLEINSINFMKSKILKEKEEKEIIIKNLEKELEIMLNESRIQNKKIKDLESIILNREEKFEINLKEIKNNEKKIENFEKNQIKQNDLISYLSFEKKFMKDQENNFNEKNQNIRQILIENENKLFSLQSENKKLKEIINQVIVLLLKINLY